MPERQTKVYIVTSGSYSDYRIDACFRSKAAAETFCDEAKKTGNHEMGVEEHDLLDFAPKARRYYIVYVDAGGNEEEMHRGTGTHFPQDAPKTWVRQDTRGARGVSPRGYAVALRAARDALMQAKVEGVAFNA